MLEIAKRSHAERVNGARAPERRDFKLRMAGAVSVIGVTIALGCGANAAAPGVAGAADTIKAEHIAGRWTGNHYSYAAARAKCDGKPCELTIDVTPCGTSWCGVLVKADGGCGASAMKVEASDGKEAYLHFTGRLALDAKAADYAVQATLWKKEGTGEAHLDFIGDTGPELMFYRRSFPFQAHLVRSGEPVCTHEKATS